MEERIKKLEQQVIELTKKFDSLNTPNTIDNSIDVSWRGRGFLQEDETVDITETDYTSMDNSISISGNPQTIHVFQYPTHWIKLRNEKDQIYYLPIYEKTT